MQSSSGNTTPREQPADTKTTQKIVDNKKKKLPTTSQAGEDSAPASAVTNPSVSAVVVSPQTSGGNNPGNLHGVMQLRPEYYTQHKGVANPRDTCTTRMMSKNFYDKIANGSIIDGGVRFIHVGHSTTGHDKSIVLKGAAQDSHRRIGYNARLNHRVYLADRKFYHPLGKGGVVYYNDIAAVRYASTGNKISTLLLTNGSSIDRADLVAEFRDLDTIDEMMLLYRRFERRNPDQLTPLRVKMLKFLLDDVGNDVIGELMRVFASWYSAFPDKGFIVNSGVPLEDVFKYSGSASEKRIKELFKQYIDKNYSI